MNAERRCRMAADVVRKDAEGLDASRVFEGSPMLGLSGLVFRSISVGEIESDTWVSTNGLRQFSVRWQIGVGTAACGFR